MHLMHSPSKCAKCQRSRRTKIEAHKFVAPENYCAQVEKRYVVSQQGDDTLETISLRIMGAWKSHAFIMTHYPQACDTKNDHEKKKVCKKINKLQHSPTRRCLPGML